MAAELSTKTIIRRESLTAVAESRLLDADALVQAGRFTAAVYIGGYTVECYLKAAICKTLDLDELPGTFAVHNLEVLLFYSGLNRQIQGHPSAHYAFNKLRDVWSERVRYEDPAKYTKTQAESVINWVIEVVQWIKPKTS